MHSETEPGTPDGAPRSAARQRRIRRWCALSLAVLAIPFAAFPGQIFFEGYESGKLMMPRWQIQSRGECRIERVDSPVRAGHYAERFTTDRKGRCEAVPWVGKTIFGRQELEPFGEDRWYGFSIYLPDDWKRPDTGANASTIVAQWHSSPDPFLDKGGRGPPLALRVRDGEWSISYGWERDLISRGDNPRGVLWHQPIETGKWTDWVFHVRWSYHDDGLTEVWKDGVRIARREGPNAYNDFRGVYLKLGVYHPSMRRSVIHDELRIGDASADYETVAPR